MTDFHFVDLCFPIHGKMIPADSAYHLYSALCSFFENQHLPPEVGVMAIKGRPENNRMLTITTQSKLVLRLPQTEIARYLSLAGKSIQLDQAAISLQGGYLRPLIPAPRLYSRLVIIKGYTEAKAFLLAAQKQLAELDAQAQASLVPQYNIAEQNQGKHQGTNSPFLRRTLKIKSHNIVGFAVRVENLNAESSLLLQEKGLGGRRHFGCGLFVEDRN